MKFLIILALAVAASAFPESELTLRNRVLPVQDDIEGRITGGSTATNAQFPYQVGLSLRINALSSAWCGGSLIGNQWVLTAAHCTDGIPSVTVYLGATVRTSAEVTYTVSQNDIIIHSGWNSKTIQNDISLIKIPAVATSSRIQIVRLPAEASSYSNYVGQSAVASGWGRTSDAANGVTNNLQYINVVIAANSDCSRVFGTASVTSSNICINTPGGKSTCNGDSGGPLVLNSNKEQIGLTSFGAAAGCEKNYPAVFTRVTSYRTWIRERTGV